MEGMAKPVMVFSAHPLDVKEEQKVIVLGALGRPGEEPARLSGQATGGRLGRFRHGDSVECVYAEGGPSLGESHWPLAATDPLATIRKGSVMAKKSEPAFAIGVDYGTNSVRALVVDIADGREVATHVYDYPSGEAGILLDPKDPHTARQNPADYIEGFYRCGRLRGAGGRVRSRLSPGARRRHRRRYDRLDAHPRRSQRHAAGPAARVRP